MSLYEILFSRKVVRANRRLTDIDVYSPPGENDILEILDSECDSGGAAKVHRADVPALIAALQKWVGDQ